MERVQGAECADRLDGDRVNVAYNEGESVDHKRVLETLEYMKTICLDGDTERDIQAAIDAVNKQIPKEPVVTGDVYFSFWCPSCKSLLDFGEKYCGFCGQALSCRLE